MLKRALYIFLLILLSGFSQRPSEAEEYSLKAAFIYNFTKYFEWQNTSNEQEFIIGVLGDSPILKPLTQIAKTKTVNGQKISIQNFKTPYDIRFSHILFVSGNSSYSLFEILPIVSSNGTLVVSEKTGSALKGAAINFVIVNNNLRFEANTKAINSSGLKASSQLLKLALSVE